MQQLIPDILKRNQLSVTESRQKILELFQQSTSALAHADIEKLTREQFDRVTIYRTLQTFVEKGIIHVIPSTDNAVYYALCKEECAAGKHHDDHIHFICDGCGTTYCLDHVSIPEIKLPNGFISQQIDVLVSGNCGNCGSTVRN